MPLGSLIQRVIGSQVLVVSFFLRITMESCSSGFVARVPFFFQKRTTTSSPVSIAETRACSRVFITMVTAPLRPNGLVNPESDGPANATSMEMIAVTQSTSSSENPRTPEEIIL